MAAIQETADMPPSFRPITVLIADDHVVLATALFHYLEEFYRTESPVNSVAQLRDTLASWQQREGWRSSQLVVLLDIKFPNEDGLTALPKLIRENPEVRFLIFSAVRPSLTRHVIHDGAAGFISKGSGPKELRAAIEGAARGKICHSDPDTVGSLGEPTVLSPVRPLSPVLRRVLIMLQKGRNRREIATILGISLSGVEANITRIRRCFGIRHSARIDWKRCRTS